MTRDTGARLTTLINTGKTNGVVETARRSNAVLTELNGRSSPVETQTKTPMMTVAAMILAVASGA